MHTRLAKTLLGLKETPDKLLTQVPINITGRFQGRRAAVPPAARLMADSPRSAQETASEESYGLRKEPGQGKSPAVGVETTWLQQVPKGTRFPVSGHDLWSGSPSPAQDTTVPVT